MRRLGGVLAGVVLAAGSLAVVGVSPAGATTVADEASFRAVWGNAAETQIDLAADITLTCDPPNGGPRPARASATALVLDGHGHTITQACPGNGVLGQTGTGAITLVDVTLTGADAPAAVGGGIRVLGGAPLTVTNSTITKNTGATAGGIVAEGAVTITNSFITDNVGGGISAAGSLEITGSTISGNGLGIEALGSATAITDSKVTDNTLGGGILVPRGTLTVTASLISGNRNDDPGRVNDGGGIQASGGEVLITISTITGNTGGAGRDDPGEAVGGSGGIDSVGPVKLVFSTVLGNTYRGIEAGGGANIDLNDDGTLTSFGSVVALPQGGPNCANIKSTISEGFSFSDDSSCGFTTPTDKQSAGDPGLDELRDNAGPTATHLPLAGSPLIDAIPNANCGDGNTVAGFPVVADQRHLVRPEQTGRKCDIGAVEVQLPPAPAPVEVVIRFTG